MDYGQPRSTSYWRYTAVSPNPVDRSVRSRVESVLEQGDGLAGLCCRVVTISVHVSKSRIASVRCFRQHSHRLVALTYDDGPGPSLTSAVMKILHTSRAKATFFLLGRRVVQSSTLVSDLRDAGHELGCHTHDHLHAWKTWPSRITRDIDRGYETLSLWVPADGMFRPPYGKMTPWSYRAIRKRGARIGWWTVDSGDTWTKLPEPESVVERVRRAGGGVVLMHDFDREGIDREERAAFVLRTTELLLEMAKKDGLRVCTLGEVLDSMDRERAAKTRR